MNKQELITSVAEKSGLTKKNAEAAVNAFMKSVEEALVTGDKVQILGFGTFETRVRKARLGRNPKMPTERISIPEGKGASFKAGKALKDAVNK